MKTSRLLFAVVALLSLFATPLQAQDQFGSAVAIDGDKVLVLKPHAGVGFAGVFVYANDGDNGWSQRQRLRPTGSGNSGEGFSASISLSGDVLMVGSGDPDVALGAHVYTLNANEWTAAPPVPIISGEDGSDQTTFDFAALLRIMNPPVRTVSLDGEIAATIAVGATGDKAGLHIYHFADGVWSLEARIGSPSDSVDAAFGAALLTRGNRVFVGAPGLEGSGAVLVFTRSDAGEWSQEITIQADLEDGAAFGSAIAFDGSNVMVGAPGDAARPGTVVSFAVDEAGQWFANGPITPAETAPGDGFGNALALEGDELWIGAPGADGAKGIVRRFHLDEMNGVWQERMPLRPRELQPRFAFGTSVALSPALGVVGAPGADGSTGRAAVVDRTSGNVDWIRVAPDFETVATGEDVKCEDGVAASFACRGVDLLSFLPVAALGGADGEGLSDLWGWTDPETHDEYALVGRTNGTAFVDITDPTSPRYLGVMPANASGTRDIKVYQNHVFVTGGNAGDHGMLIMDLTRLRDVGDEPVTFEPDVRYTEVASAHNLIIDTSSGFAFIVGASDGGQTCGGGLHMVDIRDPENPTFAGCYTDTEGLIWQGRTHDAQCVNYDGPDQNYQGREICFASNETALRIVDVTDKDTPNPIAAATYPGMSYVHQGWLTEDKRYFFLDDELDEIVGQTEFTRTMIWDVAELDDPVLVGEYFGPNGATDHNLYIKGDRMYQANYQAGFRVVDVSDPENPAEVGFFDTTPYDGDPTGFNGGAWTAFPFFESGTVIVSSSGEGLFVVRPSSQELVP